MAVSERLRGRSRWRGSRASSRTVAQRFRVNDANCQNDEGREMPCQSGIGRAFALVPEQHTTEVSAVQKQVISQFRNNTASHARSEEHTSELQSLTNLVCRLL